MLLLRTAARDLFILFISILSEKQIFQDFRVAGVPGQFLDAGRALGRAFGRTGEERSELAFLNFWKSEIQDFQGSLLVPSYAGSSNNMAD